MPPGAGDFAHIDELFSVFGPVVVRRMFGGAGIYADGVMIGILDEGVIYLKADATTAPAFEREGCPAFTYASKNGRSMVMSYWRMPERLYDDPDELALWARTAFAVAQRAAATKRKPLGGAARREKGGAAVGGKSRGPQAT